MPDRATTGSVGAIALPRGERTTATEVAARRARAAALALVVIVAAGLGVRLYGLTAYGIWFDEAYHLALIRLPTLGDMFGAVLANPPSCPLYVLVLRVWITFFGTDDASVRLLSVIFGTLTIPATYLLGTALAGRTAGLLSALLIAFSPYALEFSQEAALYALSALLTTLALALGLRWHRSGRGAMVYLLAAALALYSHYVVALVMLLYAVAMTLPYFREGRGVKTSRWLTVNGAVFALWLPWSVPMLISWIAGGPSRAGLSQEVTFGDVAGAVGQYTAGTAALLSRDIPLMLAGVASAGALLLAGSLFAARSERRAASLLLLVAALIFIGPALAAFVTHRWLFVPHFMLFLLPALAAVGSAGVAWAASTGEREPAHRILTSALGLCFAVLLLVEVLGTIRFYSEPPHGADGLRELAAELNRDVRSGEVVYVTPPALSVSLEHYFGGKIDGLPEDFDLRRIYLAYNPADWQGRSLVRVGEGVIGKERFWLVYRPERDDGGALLNRLKEKFEPVRSTSYGFGTLYLFTVQP